MTPNRVGRAQPMLRAVRGRRAWPQPMLRAVRGRRAWPRGARRVPNRWCAWADDHRGGRARLDRPYRRAGMAFLQPWPTPATGHAPARHAYSHLTHLRLAVDAVLVSHPAGSYRDGGRQPAGPTVLAHRWHAFPPGGPSPQGPSPELRPIVSSRRATATSPERRGHPTAVRPLWSVLATRRDPVPGHGGVAGAGNAVRTVIGELVTRVVGSHRRVEIRVRGSGAVHAQPGVAGAVERVPTGARQPATSAHPGPAAAPRGGPDPTPVDLERLTDQIVSRLDDRLTAQRERFGRAF